MPHSGQNFVPGGSSLPQFTQNAFARTSTFVPHSEQNFVPGVSILPQFAHVNCSRSFASPIGTVARCGSAGASGAEEGAAAGAKGAKTDAAIAQITEVLRKQHKLRDTDEDNFTIRSQAELSAMMNSTTDMMTTLLACIAGISLVVGGIGIMNIEYVSVTERTKEIGLRMSVGARGIDIMSQFLIEAVIISITGGIIGVLLGVIATVLVNILASWPVYIEPWSVLLSFSVCALTGVFFGWYPARKAASLNPIDAIRYE